MSTPPEPLYRLDLRSLDLVSGAAGHVEAPVPVADLVHGRADLPASSPPRPIGRVDVSVASSGRLFRLRTQAEVVGPCWRCLEEARAPVVVDAREYAAANRPPDAEFDDDLDSVYLDGPILDVATWARDAVVGELPPSILCRPRLPRPVPDVRRRSQRRELRLPAPAARRPLGRPRPAGRAASQGGVRACYPVAPTRRERGTNHGRPKAQDLEAAA